MHLNAMVTASVPLGTLLNNMFFLGAKFVPKQLWERKNHNHLYNSSLNIFEQANTRIEVFYAVQGKRIERNDKPRVDALVQVLQRCSKSLQQNAAQALEPSTRHKLGERDFKCVLRFEREVHKYLENVLELQAKLQRQLDAEQYFEKQKEDRDQQGRLQTIVEEKEKRDKYLNKPLPPLRKSIVNFASGVRSRVTIEPGEKDVEVWFMLEDEELIPIIEAYSQPNKMAFEQDGFIHSPRNKLDWI